MLKENCLNEGYYEISKLGNILLIIIISACMFLVPILVPTALTEVFGTESTISNNSQIVVGAIINTTLVMSAISVKGWKNIVALITVPSISALTSGLVLSVSSIFTVYMIPAIWIGNLLLVYSIKSIYVKNNKNFVLASVIGILGKALIIFAGFNLLTLLISMPEHVKMVLTTAMGLNQVITAILGCVIAYGITKVMFKNNKNN